MTDPPERIQSLLDILRQVERILDDQRRTLSEETALGEALGRLGAGVLAGLLAVLGMLAEVGFRPSLVPAGAIALGTTATLAGTLQAVWGISRTAPQTTYMGADPSALLGQVGSDVERGVVLATMISAGMRAAHMNERIFAGFRVRRGRSFALLVTGVATLLLGFGYIVGGQILG